MAGVNFGAVQLTFCAEFLMWFQHLSAGAPIMYYSVTNPLSAGTVMFDHCDNLSLEHVVGVLWQGRNSSFFAATIGANLQMSSFYIQTGLL